MGAWGVGSFENDDAADFIAVFEERGADALRHAFTAIAHDDYVEIPEGAVAIAAAEIVASALGNRPSAPLPPSLIAALAMHQSEVKEDGKALLRSARMAVERVTTGHSELKDLWEESLHEEAWRASIADLIARLQE